MKDQLIYCANCFHCKVFEYPPESSKMWLKCSKEQWGNQSGNENIFQLELALQCRASGCKLHDSMGEDNLDEFITSLKLNFNLAEPEDYSHPTAREFLEENVIRF